MFMGSVFYAIFTNYTLHTLDICVLLSYNTANWHTFFGIILMMIKKEYLKWRMVDIRISRL